MKKIIFLLLFIASVQLRAQQSGLGISYLGNDYYSVQTKKLTLSLKDSSQFPTFDNGLRFSYLKNLNRWFDFQGNFNYNLVDMPGSSLDSNFILRKWNNYVGYNPKKNYMKSMAEIDARLNLNLLDRTKWMLNPYLFAGVSATMSDFFGATVPLGAGLQFKISKGISLNAEMARRFAITNNDLDRNQYALGLIFWNKGNKQVKTPKVVSKDRDGDGVNDDVDACPDVKGLVAFAGCPDTDGDGIADKDDKCPNVAGIAKYAGCPIPDTDGDGLNDEMDKCPTVAGIAKYAGCPIPDSDKDGFNDDVDKCPNVYSTTNNGCPEIKKDIIEKVKKAAGAVYFDTGKSTIKKTSLKQLDVIAEVLKDDQSLFCDIIGNTDNSGNYDKNVMLSDARAKSCLDYLVSKGISASRLTSKGVGPDKPVADNATPAGRAMNRRTEFNLRNF